VWVASQQRPGGAFRSDDHAQPGVTGLCVLAMLSRGHLPGQGPMGQNINRGIEFILSTQRDDGLFSFGEPEEDASPRNFAHTAMYNHAIASLALSEAYGMARGSDAKLASHMHTAIERARDF